jgi:hypothetical protein
MKVTDLQQLLRQFATFVRAAGAAEKVSAEIDRTWQSFEPFRDKTLADFNDFLRKADEYERTGVLSSPVKERAARPAKAQKLTVDAAAEKFHSLYENATDTSVEYTTIDSEIDKFKQFTVKDLLLVAEKVKVTLPGKLKKEQILDELKRRIKGYKASFDRTQFGRSESTETSGSGSPS